MPNDTGGAFPSHVPWRGTSIPEILRRARQLGIVAKGQKIHRSTVHRLLIRLGIPVKRRRSASERDSRRFAYPHRMMMVLYEMPRGHAGEIDVGRSETIDRAESLIFASYILGWHEIEQAATDANVRRLYLDAIAGRSRIRELEEDIEILVRRIREKHDHAGSKYNLFQGLHQQVTRLEELRKGLQTLRDANLIALRDQYKAATDDRAGLVTMLECLKKVRDGASAHVQHLLSGIELPSTRAGSPLDTIVAKARATLLDSSSQRNFLTSNK